jgi:hypothetical protein
MPALFDQHVDPAEVRLRSLDRGDPLRRLRHVQFDRERPLRVTRGETAHAVHRSRGQHDAIATLQHDLRRNNRYEGRATIAGSNRVPRSRRRNCCSDWALIEGICGGVQAAVLAAVERSGVTTRPTVHITAHGYGKRPNRVREFSRGSNGNPCTKQGRLHQSALTV